jgi:hypothetical protein
MEGQQVHNGAKKAEIGKIRLRQIAKVADVTIYIGGWKCEDAGPD